MDGNVERSGKGMRSGVGQAIKAILTRMAVAAAVALAGAAIWTGLAGGSLVQRFGWLLAIAGVLMAIPSGSGYSRAETRDENMWLGRGPDPPHPDLDVGGVGLTRFGIFVFVSIPLFLIGVWIS
jgi:hypothetical protein